MPTSSALSTLLVLALPVAALSFTYWPAKRKRRQRLHVGAPINQVDGAVYLDYAATCPICELCLPRSPLP